MTSTNIQHSLAVSILTIRKIRNRLMLARLALVIHWIGFLIFAGWYLLLAISIMANLSEFQEALSNSIQRDFAGEDFGDMIIILGIAPAISFVTSALRFILTGDFLLFPWGKSKSNVEPES